MKFNLQQTLKMVKDAMAEWGVYQPAKNWWRLDEIENGDPEWEKWVNGVPEKGLPPNESMENALNTIRNWYYNKKLFLRARYGLNADEVNNIFRVWVGYDPLKGVYQMSVGPYFAEAGAWKRVKKICAEQHIPLKPDKLLEYALGLQIPEGTAERAADPNYKIRMDFLSVRSDMLNKFGYFMRRFRRFDKDEIMAARQKLIDQAASTFGAVLDPSQDLMFVHSTFPQEEVGKAIKTGESDDEESGTRVSWQKEYIKMVEGDPSFDAFLAKKPVLSENSEATYTSSGKAKIWAAAAEKGGWKDIFEAMLQSMATKQNIPVEQARNELLSNEKFLAAFTRSLKAMVAEMKKNGDPRADFVNIPDFAKQLKPVRKGSLRTEVFRVKTPQKNLAELKMDIISAIVATGSEDLQAICDYLNAQRKQLKTKAQGVFTPELIQPWLEAFRAQGQVIKKGKLVSQKGWPEILEDAKKEVDDAKKNEDLRDVGFIDMGSAYRLASTYFMESALEFIDPKSHAKINLPDPPNMFERGDEVQVTSSKLTKFRMTARKKGTEEEIKKALKAEVLKEIGDANAGAAQAPKEDVPMQEPQDFEVTDMPVEPGATEAPPEEPAATPPQDFSITEVPGAKPIDQEKVSPPTPAEPVAPTAPASTVPSATTEAPAPTPPTPKKKKAKLPLQNLFGGTLQSLIVMARDLDAQGKENAAEEIHKIIRKYQDRIKD
jgi:hypothetical protein